METTMKPALLLSIPMALSFYTHHLLAQSTQEQPSRVIDLRTLLPKSYGKSFLIDETHKPRQLNYNQSNKSSTNISSPQPSNEGHPQLSPTLTRPTLSDIVKGVSPLNQSSSLPIPLSTPLQEDFLQTSIPAPPSPLATDSISVPPTTSATSTLSQVIQTESLPSQPALPSALRMKTLEGYVFPSTLSFGPGYFFAQGDDGTKYLLQFQRKDRDELFSVRHSTSSNSPYHFTSDEVKRLAKTGELCIVVQPTQSSCSIETLISEKNFTGNYIRNAFSKHFPSIISTTHLTTAHNQRSSPQELFQEQVAPKTFYIAPTISLVTPPQPIQEKLLPLPSYNPLGMVTLSMFLDVAFLSMKETPTFPLTTIKVGPYGCTITDYDALQTLINEGSFSEGSFGRGDSPSTITLTLPLTTLETITKIKYSSLPSSNWKLYSTCDTFNALAPYAQVRGVGNESEKLFSATELFQKYNHAIFFWMGIKR